MTSQDAGIGLDLVRSESLTSLDRPTMNRLLNKNYHVAISMSPLNEVGVISDSDTFHMIGPTAPIVASVWMKLYIYELVGSGPISMLFPIQSNLQSIPEVFQKYDELLVQSFTHEPVVARTSNVMFMIHEILQNSPVLIQGYTKKNFTSSKTFIPFNHPTDTMDGGDADKSNIAAKLHEKLGLQHTCGYLTLLNTTAAPKNGTTKEATEHDTPCLLDINFGIPLFEESLNHEVCEGIVNSDILGKESLLSLTKFNEGLVKDVVAFVQAQNQWRDPSVHPKQTITKHKSKVPFPMSTLIFQHGKVTSWKP
uniref:FAM91 C-terminal domain-containing protein n=1 Tax=Ciona savignyi TaxID=51511 RepID=H2Z761_CIOSA